MSTIYETERLTVRQWTDTEADVGRIYDIYSRWEVAGWLGAQPRAMADRAEAGRSVARWRELTEHDPRFGAWAIQRKDTGQIAGTVLFKLLPNSDGSQALDVEVGWHLHPDSWGHGYATEAARGAIHRGFAAGISEVYAVVYPDNAPSIAVCCRLGMARLGTTDRWYNIVCEAFRIANGDRAQ